MSHNFLKPSVRLSANWFVHSHMYSVYTDWQCLLFCLCVSTAIIRFPITTWRPGSRIFPLIKASTIITVPCNDGWLSGFRWVLSMSRAHSMEVKHVPRNNAHWAELAGDGIDAYETFCTGNGICMWFKAWATIMRVNLAAKCNQHNPQMDNIAASNKLEVLSRWPTGSEPPSLVVPFATLDGNTGLKPASHSSAFHAICSLVFHARPHWRPGCRSLKHAIGGRSAINCPWHAAFLRPPQVPWDASWRNLW